MNEKFSKKKMCRITFMCDRCYKVSEGLINPNSNETEGFYYVKDGDFADLKIGKEKNVCEKCIDRKINGKN